MTCPGCLALERGQDDTGKHTPECVVGALPDVDVVSNDWDDEPCSHDCDDECYDQFDQWDCHQHCLACGECGCPGYCDDHRTYNMRPAETGGGEIAPCGCPKMGGMIRHDRSACTDPVVTKLDWYG